jgi:glycosyltransferase involved in cell wall biosynthesis
MKIEVIAIAWNEIELAPFFVKHYKSFCHKITVYDNGSTDGTDIALKKLGCDVRQFGNGELDDREYLKIKNHGWKGSESDYVIVCDFDEFLYHPDIINYLEYNLSKKVNIFDTQGIDVYSINMPLPGHDIIKINTGLESAAYSKRVIFSPLIDNINFDYGCHKSQPQGNLRWDKSRNLRVLHYRNIGGPGRLLKRHKAYQTRMCEYNRKKGLGVHYLRSDQQIVNDFNKYLNLSSPQF